MPTLHTTTDDRCCWLPGHVLGAHEAVRHGVDRALAKHASEMLAMRGAAHTELVPLIEGALAVMRLSCERFFVLASCLAAYLLFRDDAPHFARALIRLNDRLSTTFQRVQAPPHLMSVILNGVYPHMLKFFEKMSVAASG